MEKIIYHIDQKGNAIDISETALIRDYLRLNYIPTIDDLLDFRNRLIELGKNDFDNDSSLYAKEIFAIDFLLNQKSNS